MIIYMIEKINDIIPIINNYKYYDDIIEFFITGKGEKYFIDLVYNINEHLKITHSIVEWCKDYTLAIKKRISKIDPLLNIKLIQNTLRKIYKGKNKFDAILCSPMDIYCIYRLFTKFNPIRTEIKKM